MFIGMLSALFILGVFLSLQKTSFVSIIAITFALLPIVFLNLTTLKKLKKNFMRERNFNKYSFHEF